MTERTFGIPADAVTQREAVLGPIFLEEIIHSQPEVPADSIELLRSAADFAAREVAECEEHHAMHVGILNATISAQQELIERQRPYAIRRTLIRWAGSVIIWLSGVWLLYSLTHH